VTRVLTPELTLAYVRELSCDVAAAELRSPSGERLAGGAVDGERTVRVRCEAGELALALGPCAVEALVRYDAQTALAALSRPAEAS
jgi:hypothetical protein